MSFRKPCHMPFRKLIPLFTLTETEKKKTKHLLNTECYLDIFDAPYPFRIYHNSHHVVLTT